jgi:hypothetical protein
MSGQVCSAAASSSSAAAAAGVLRRLRCCSIARPCFCWRLGTLWGAGHLIARCDGQGGGHTDFVSSTSAATASDEPEALFLCTAALQAKTGCLHHSKLLLVRHLCTACCWRCGHGDVDTIAAGETVVITPSITADDVVAWSTISVAISIRIRRRVESSTGYQQQSAN